MKLKQVCFFTGITLLFITFFSCENCKNKAKIEVSELLKLHTSERGIPYCSILSKAVLADSVSVTDILIMDIQDGARYDHAIVLTELIYFLGEGRVMSLAKPLDKKQKARILQDIYLGINYASMITVKDVNIVFPIISNEWQ